MIFWWTKVGDCPETRLVRLLRTMIVMTNRATGERSCRNELSIFNYSKDPDSMCVCPCVCGFWLVCSSEYVGNEKISTEIRCWFRPKS